MIKKCEKCGKEFKGRKESKFCSYNCSNSRKRNGITLYKYICIVCNKIFYSKKKNLKGYCSRNCQCKNDMAKRPKTKEHCLKIGKALKGQKRSKEFREKYRQNMLGRKLTEEHKKNISRSIREYIKNNPQNHFYGKDTYPELKVEEYLKNLKITYEKQYKVGWYSCDFFIPKKNIIIEVQGDYWHCNPDVYSKPKNEMQVKNIKRDKQKKKYFIEHGYILIEIWEKDIHDNNFSAIKM